MKKTLVVIGIVGSVAVVLAVSLTILFRPARRNDLVAACMYEAGFDCGNDLVKNGRPYEYLDEPEGKHLGQQALAKAASLRANDSWSGSKSGYAKYGAANDSLGRLNMILDQEPTEWAQMIKSGFSDAVDGKKPKYLALSNTVTSTEQCIVELNRCFAELSAAYYPPELPFLVATLGQRLQDELKDYRESGVIGGIALEKAVQRHMGDADFFWHFGRNDTDNTNQIFFEIPLAFKSWIPNPTTRWRNRSQIEDAGSLTLAGKHSFEQGSTMYRGRYKFKEHSIEVRFDQDNRQIAVVFPQIEDETARKIKKEKPQIQYRRTLAPSIRISFESASTKSQYLDPKRSGSKAGYAEFYRNQGVDVVGRYRSTKTDAKKSMRAELEWNEQEWIEVGAKAETVAVLHSDHGGQSTNKVTHLSVVLGIVAPGARSTEKYVPAGARHRATKKTRWRPSFAD